MAAARIFSVASRQAIVTSRPAFTMRGKPLERPAVESATLTAALMVFIEAMKELSATIMLRPFNFNTLATLVYEDASRAKVEDASVAAMIIVAAGLVPVFLVSRSLNSTNGGR